MEGVDVSQGHASLLQDHKILSALTPESLAILRDTTSSHFLRELSTVALNPNLTTRVYSRLSHIFPDICARWISEPEHPHLAVFESFARILPFAPHLAVYLHLYLETPRLQLSFLSHSSNDEDLGLVQPLALQGLLLAVFRLLRHDRSGFYHIIPTAKVQTLLHYDDLAVRYLAVRLLCILLSASDYKLEEMTVAYVGKTTAIPGAYDGTTIDYGFLSLFEEKRRKDVLALQQETVIRPAMSRTIPRSHFSPLVTVYGQVVLPRPLGLPSTTSSLILTPTTIRNLQEFSRALTSRFAILVHGLSGSGKTAVVNDVARDLGKQKTLVTLHLNEQTDAKMLLGMYTSGATPGSFVWRAGVLTTAVREGRWVFIEDLDRAPNEVLSVILPLIENGELLIPSRGERIKAAPGFQVIASVRTTVNLGGAESQPGTHMLGSRLWTRVHIQLSPQEEYQQIIRGKHPLLQAYIPGIIAVYVKLQELSSRTTSTLKDRSSNPRNLLKWCRRLESILLGNGGKTGNEPIHETTQYEMFMEAADVFTSSLQVEAARQRVVESIAEEMRVPPLVCRNYLDAYVPQYEDFERSLRIGRAKLPKRVVSGRTSRIEKKSRPFANTSHAKRLLEQVGVALKMAEPVLLVGETGIGKTTVIQQLADSLGCRLTAVNLSQQSEVGDLLGGFKPVNVRSLAIPLKEEFDELFLATGLSPVRNEKYLMSIGKCCAKGQWSRAAKLWKEAPKMFKKILKDIQQLEATKATHPSEQPAKRRKTESRLQALIALQPRWHRFAESLEQFDVQISGGAKGFAFSFVEGNIVKAVRNGEWVLLDEINLASPDTLEAIADLLQSGSGTMPSILLSETGEIERIAAHPDFRIFGAMNPATDVGKKDLPMGLRSRFTEIYVQSPDKDLDGLLPVVEAYLHTSSSTDKKAAHDVARLYLKTKEMAMNKELVDGAEQSPHFSLRTLTRVLSYVTEIAPSYGLRRSLYEGFAMGFLTLLNRESELKLIPEINKYILSEHKNPRALLAQTPQHPEDGRQYVRFMSAAKDRQYWMLQGHEIPQEDTGYIRDTLSVERNLLNLVRATSTRKFPVLIQGPTSAGKTSMIEFLARFSGNKFVRINNHEHTDLQEYLGTYISGTDGQLRFQEGILVQALRLGYWIVLDELNLAPTDVLEALNRLLDDNRELLIPETQEVVRPHENFMLFATQNPAGLYGGRKVLSRAFRNRFLELHFDDIPEEELATILERRSKDCAPSQCKLIVSVYKELSMLRQKSRIFEQKGSFATLRDLFRWASRHAGSHEELAANGFMLLGERVRNPKERQEVKEIIERVFKLTERNKNKIDLATLYSVRQSPEIQQYQATSNARGVVWTSAMRRLYVLVAHALRNNEPVLLVGETGCGKTTVCQMLADALGMQLNIVNAHQNTETGDLIGAQRPVRNRAQVLQQLELDLQSALAYVSSSENLSVSDDAISTYASLSPALLSNVPLDLQARVATGQGKAKALFEWCDGSLVQAMREARFFLLDEISLADDSVLERLNSVLEPSREILLAEKGVTDSFVKAADGFQFFATMNPGGDYGKRELSPALRNRFTEIWVPSLSESEDIMHIIETKLAPPNKSFANAMVDFAEWFGRSFRSASTQTVSIRDVLGWVNFMNISGSQEPTLAFMNGAALVYIDTLGANPAALTAGSPDSIVKDRQRCLKYLGSLVGIDFESMYSTPIMMSWSSKALSFGPYDIIRTTEAAAVVEFAFDAPTTKLNAMRVVRALQLTKPILLEGSPGVGKTTLIAALAQAVGKPLTRINLSEQTDLMDLFGSDIPVDGAEAGNFAWRDAAFLQAMQNGDWVLLDEMNLASQSVLEGLNACLDHRGEVYISELDQTFQRHPDFKVFAAQNPHHQGGGRKGLPSSFVNRFTVVYADVFRSEDLTLICKRNFPDMTDTTISQAVAFVCRLEHDIVHQRNFGSQGGPWELNLRDTLRWLRLISSSKPLLAAGRPADFLHLIFRQRFRSKKDRDYIDTIYTEVFGSPPPFRHQFYNLALDAYQVGMAYLPRNKLAQHLSLVELQNLTHLDALESVMLCVQENIPCIIVGPSGCGKTSLLQHLAAATGANLITFSLNADIDTMDLVGGFEQSDPQRAYSALLSDLLDVLDTRILSSLPSTVPAVALQLMTLCHQRSSSQSWPQVQHMITGIVTLQAEVNIPELEALLSRARALESEPQGIKNARFEWIDGTLVKAVETGKWLVLDNANLCSSSVLDRLNSLLEPNGVLSVNEHCDANGQPKLVRPHPNFRLFITMDPRYGELSRAMRNRAVEIYIDHTSTGPKPLIPYLLAPECQLIRYAHVVQSVDVGKPGATEIALQALSRADLELMPRFAATLPDLAIENAGLARNAISGFREVLGVGTVELEALYTGLAQVMGLPKSFSDAQTIHPLQNSPLVPLAQLCCSSDEIYSVAATFETRLEMLKARKQLELQGLVLQTVKPSHMTRLQRALVANRVSSAAKDSTAKGSDFLQDVLQILDFYVQNATKTNSWRTRRRVLRQVIRLWNETYGLLATGTFEEATFQAHLTISEEVLSTAATTTRNVEKAQYDMVVLVKTKLDHCFDHGFRLTTGLSMESLWRRLRPLPLISEAALRIMLGLETLARRLDAIRWKVPVTVRDLVAITTLLLDGFNAILCNAADGDALLTALDSELSNLEHHLTPETQDSLPFFALHFEALRQYGVAASWSSISRKSQIELAVLANYSTVSSLRSITVHGDQALRHVDEIWDDGSADLLVVKDSFSIEVLSRLRKIDLVTLKTLRLLELELPALAKVLVGQTVDICARQVGHHAIFDVALQRIMRQFLAAADEDLSALLENALSTASRSTEPTTTTIAIIGKQQISPSIRAIFEEYISPCVEALAALKHNGSEDLKHTAIAWTNFAEAGLLMYVPDRPFDPDKRQKLERERYHNIFKALQDEIDALKNFEATFSEQDSNLRIQLLQNDVAELGMPPSISQQTYRPEVSELSALQGEFNNLLNILKQSAPSQLVLAHVGMPTVQTLQQLRLIQKNISQLMYRLTEQFRAYDDITVPAVGLLQCLQVGIAMAVMSTPDETPEKAIIRNLSAMTPFLGGQPSAAIDSGDLTIAQLSQISTIAAVEGLEKIGSGSQQQFFNVIHTTYEDWVKRLESDRKDADARGGFYRYRGSAEDEEEVDQEQFNELFPTFDEGVSTNGMGSKDKNSTRNMAIMLADAHARVVYGSDEPKNALMDQIRYATAQIGKHGGEKLSFIGEQMTRNLLPGMLVNIVDQLDSLQGSRETPETYNFYTSANLTESRKLVALVYQIQTRYRQLQAVDEIAHMQPLADVLVACDELLLFQHTEPLAKLITKVEKVHAYMYEWQFGGWASRMNSALELHNSLTQTIISWRRIELSTWAKLFDMENQQCEEDAKSWWFIAYQVVIAAPLSTGPSELEQRSYAHKLLQDLESYFSSSIQGQFSQRLSLLEQLYHHLVLLDVDMPYLGIVSTALRNFLDLYSKFEQPVSDNLRRGKALLEKQMKDVLLSASYKDTNIVALRDSAKRSHHKLFKLVRKYRALLGQPCDMIIRSGLPEDALEKTLPQPSPSLSLPLVQQDALAHCRESVPLWTSKSKRFTNVSQTVNLMHDASVLPVTFVDCASYLDSFSSNVVFSAAELQKATPSLLTEDNKVNVKHLKTRKRKLFADTIKELREMGFSHNLGANALAKQDSTAIVLSNVGSITNHALDNFYFHRALDLLPKARAATHEHNEDLSKAEIIRSTGLLEGLLHVLLKQRQSLSLAEKHVQTVGMAVDQCQVLWSPANYTIRPAAVKTTHEKVVKWTICLLRVAITLIEIRNRLGDVQSGEIISRILEWVQVFESLSDRIQELPNVPLFLSTTAHERLQVDIDGELSRLRHALSEMTAATNHSELEFILGQIVPWTFVTSEDLDICIGGSSLAKLDDTLSKIVDMVLVSVESLQKSMSALPKDTGESSWLIRQDNTLATNISSMHANAIASQLQHALLSLSKLDLSDDNTSHTAAALFAVALPVLQQYRNILQESMYRYAMLHRALSKTTYLFAKIFIQIANQGFCTPSEKSDDKDGKSEKLEGGTGLGDGDGAEDISKDIQDDENLEELAQEHNKEETTDMEDEQDAVDMADADMEGETGEADGEEEEEDGSGDESGKVDDLDEEAGDVDDLDPNAVDEKMWDGDGEKAEKDQEGDESKGKADKDEQAAAQEGGKDQEMGENGEEEENEEDEEAAGAEQSEDVRQQDDIEKHDPKAQDGEILDLPDEMELDGDGEEREESVGSEDGMEDLSDIEDAKDEDDEDEKANDGQTEDGNAQEDQKIEDELDVLDLDKEDDPENPGDDTDKAGEQADEEPETDVEKNKEDMLMDDKDDGQADADKAVPSEALGSGDDQKEQQNNDDSAKSDSKAQHDEGGEGGDSTQERDTAAEDGEKSRRADGESGITESDKLETSAEAQPFKRLGDALEKWHRQQTKIREPAEPHEKSQEQAMEVNGDDTEFQHLQDENAEADTQALGTATEEQAHALDESMVIDQDSTEMPNTFQPDEVDDDHGQQDVMDIEDTESVEQEPSKDYEGRAGAIVKQSLQDRTSAEDEHHEQNAIRNADVEDVDTQVQDLHLTSTDINTSTITSEAARALWQHHESQTRPLSLTLTEQLRLILAPTLATKMRGDYRTGKRLNIKRIIPYIASSYKRDKIWMRRAVPSKRAYQLLLAVDNSKSMAQSGSGELAMATLVMVAKALSMLEVGEICIAAFGEDLVVAHDFDVPFSAAAGPNVLRHFDFEQSRTDIATLVRQSITLFRTARQRASSSTPTDLWQLQLIISDGVCASSQHEEISHLLRTALEERIMIVFIIVDDVRHKKKGESVMDLREARFVRDEVTGNSEVKIERYLDGFPFRYYVVVGDVGELPGVLSGLLRQWFGEVVESG